MNQFLRRAVGTIAMALLMSGLAWLSSAPYNAHDGDGALIRLAWSARPERIETCRAPSEEELARLPAHMREREVCEGTSARYRLRVSRDGELVLDEVVRGAGLRHDRPVYLLRDLEAPPGRHLVEVRFERIDSLAVPTDTSPDEPSADTGRGDLSDRRRHEAEEHRRRRLEAVPSHLSLVESVDLRRREVLLVTYQPDQRRLVTVSGPDTASR